MRAAALLLVAGLLVPTLRADEAPPSRPPDPLAALDVATRALVERVTAQPTVATPLGDRLVASKLAVFDFLVDELDLTGRLVAHLGLGAYRITKEKDGRYQVDDRSGAVARIRKLTTYVKDGWTWRLYHADGYFELPLRRKVHGDGIIRLGYRQTEKGVACTANIDFRARSKTAHTLGHGLRRLLAKVIQKKSRLFIDAAQGVSERTTKEPDRIHKLMQADEAIGAAQAGRFATRFLPTSK